MKNIFPNRILKLTLGTLILVFCLFQFPLLIHRDDKVEVASQTNKKICWEDHDFINYEKTRVGPGENGEPWLVIDEKELKINKEWVAKEGFYVDANLKMSVTRALPDHPLKRFVE